MRVSIWHGTAEEATDLLAAVEQHCTCRVDTSGVRRTSCAAHRMLFESQRVLDGLLFARGLADRWRRGEWAVSESAPRFRYYFTPSDRSAATVREFLAVCRAEPMVAEVHLQRGYFRPWLQDIGRTDLAELATRLQWAALERFLQAAEPGL
jgi:hypothetical protein